MANLKAVVAGWKWGNNHLRAFAESEVCDVSALWSRTENPNAVRVASLYHIPLYTDYDKMLEDVAPEITSIAVPEAGHEALSISALERGSHVYCEKVLADTREAGQRMVDCAANNERVLNVGYCALTMKTYMVQYENGATLMAGATDYSSSLNPGATLLVEGTEGRLMLDDLSGQVTFLNNSRESVVYAPSQIRDSIGLRENCVLAVKDFALAIHENKPAPIPGEDGVDMIALEEAIFKSADTDQWETVA